MATVGKRKLDKISRISVAHEAIQDHYGEDAKFLEHNPERWDKDQKLLYDLANSINDKVLGMVSEILEGKSTSN